MYLTRVLYFILFILLLTSRSYGQSLTNKRAEWFTEDRFGMFIHWGVYSGAEGYWKGEKLRNDNDYAEWIYYRNRIEKDEYLTLLDRFNWDEINPEEWVILAKKSGMKYVTITAKHHDGFGLWDSKVSNYDIGDFTDPKRDIVKELADACAKHKLKLGLYYSHWVDWEHEFGWDHTKEITGILPENYNKYWQEKVIPQIQELLTGYGEISIMWFDMWIHHSRTIVTKEQLLQLKSLIRELQPNCLVNSRLGLSIEEDPDIDFKTLGDNQLGNKKEDFPWQSPATVAHSWGFHSSDTQWKSTTTLLKSLINNVSLNGNFMLNIGPRANGHVPYEISQRMLEMGKWLEVNGESIYGAEAFDLDKDQHDWGKMTCKNTKEGFKLFLHLYNCPLNYSLNVTGIKTAPDKVYILADEQRIPLVFTHSDVFTKIELPVLQSDPYIPVLVVEYKRKPFIEEGLVSKTTDNGYSLTPRNIHPIDETILIAGKERRGTIPERAIIDAKKNLTWKIYIDDPGEKKVDVSYSYQSDSNKNTIIFNAANQYLSHTVQPTGKTVGEPKQNWIIDNYQSHKIGSINFPEKGIYEIALEISPIEQNKIEFQWIWIK